jgi:hypothetical protein
MSVKTRVQVQFWIMRVNSLGQLWINWNCWVNVESMLGHSWVIVGHWWVICWVILILKERFDGFDIN